ncbi:MAG: alpha/beta hydrolase [Gammaproteobacteria bacterium]|nr:alpha/beta hydrolase [Gammaproteobacteria bacterium]NNJ83516.1 alpha/beta hydrolase [Gammaproteobacteria bacterium]
MKQPDLLRAVDHPRVNSAIFFPRRDPGLPSPAGSEDFRIEVAPGISVAARYHPRKAASATILHFHGNGEIVADYDNIVPMFHAAGASLISVDYRGYGQSDGQPTARSMIDDAHVVLDFMLKMRDERGHTGPLVVMGRSLGSAPAIELAAARGDDTAGLIVESGFAQTLPLLELFGIFPDDIDLCPDDYRDNEDKMAEVQNPVLVLHAEWDQVLVPWHGKRNFECATFPRKRLIMIPNADHSTIMMFGGNRYWGGIAEFLKGLDGFTE